MQHGFTQEQIDRYRKKANKGKVEHIFRDPDGNFYDTPLSPHHFLEFPSGKSPVYVPRPTKRQEALYLKQMFDYPTPSPTPQAKTETHVATPETETESPVLTPYVETVTYVMTEAVEDQFPIRQWGSPAAKSESPGVAGDSVVKQQRSKRHSSTSAAPRDDPVVEQQRSKRRRVTSTAAPCDDSD